MRVYSQEILIQEQNALPVRQECKSNDHHIIALARISRARLLYTIDSALQQDFKNRHLLSRPRGRIYRSHKNESLLDRVEVYCKGS